MSRHRKQWYVFYDSHGRELLAVTVTGTSSGELGETIGLLAYENNIDPAEISFAVVTR